MTLFSFVFGLLLTNVSEVKTQPQQTKVTSAGPDEKQSYACAQRISTLVEVVQQAGPLFVAGDITFTSVDAWDGKPILIVNSGSGIYSMPLPKSGVNRLRFWLPLPQAQYSREFFLSYAHGGRLRSRYFEFAATAPPPGHDEIEYTLMEPKRAQHLLPQFEYAIYETTESNLNLLNEGRASRPLLKRQPSEDCAYLTRKTPHLAERIRRNLDRLEMIVFGPSQVESTVRLPASSSGEDIKKERPASR